MCARRKQKHAPAGLTAADKDIQAILDKPYKDWTGRELGRVSIYDTVEADTNLKDYRRLFNKGDSSDAIYIEDIYLLLSRSEQQTVLDYYDLYRWIITARRAVDTAEYERQLYLTKVINLLNNMSAAKQIIDSYNGNAPQEILDRYELYLPAKIFIHDSPAADDLKNPQHVITDITEARHAIFTDTAIITAFNLTISQLGRNFGIPNLNKLAFNHFTEEKIKRDDLPFYEKAYHYLYDLIADETSEDDMQYFRKHLEPKYMLRFPELMANFLSLINEWAEEKRYTNYLDLYPMREALDDTLLTSELEYRADTI